MCVILYPYNFFYQTFLPLLSKTQIILRIFLRVLYLSFHLFQVFLETSSFSSLRPAFINLRYWLRFFNLWQLIQCDDKYPCRPFIWYLPRGLYDIHWLHRLRSCHCESIYTFVARVLRYFRITESLYHKVFAICASGTQSKYICFILSFDARCITSLFFFNVIILMSVIY